MTGVADASNSIEQAKHGGDHSSRAAQLQARENEQKALSLWIKGATFQQIAAAGFGIATASGAWRSGQRALARDPQASRHWGYYCRCDCNVVRWIGFIPVHRSNL